MKCPKCEKSKDFRISSWELYSSGRTYVSLDDDGGYDIQETKDSECQDFGIWPDQEVLCQECGYEGEAEEFDLSSGPFTVDDAPTRDVLDLISRRLQLLNDKEDRKETETEELETIKKFIALNELNTGVEHGTDVQ